MTETQKENVQQRQITDGPLENITQAPQTRHNYNSITNGNVSSGPSGGVLYNPGLTSDNRQIPILRTDKKSLVEAYLLWFLFGLLGAHHFYLKRVEWGILYFLTGGLLGCGWLIDMFRMPYIVSQVNKRNLDEANVKRKNISDAYTLWFPFGLLGFHHFYLENGFMGGLYFVTGGLFGIGWLVDLARIPSLVKEANLREPVQKQEKTVGASYALGVSPLGVLGFHHFYLNRPLWGFFYLLTAGNFGIGWLVDWFRLPLLVKRANKEIALGADDQKHLDDAYLLWMPMGLLGFHHFYLNRPVWGLIYFFTSGLFGVGWLIDGFRLSCLVKECNRKTQERIEQLPVFQMPYSGVVITRSNLSTVSQVPVPPNYSNSPPNQTPGLYLVAGYQYPLQSGHQQIPDPRQMPSYAEQPPPYSSATDGVVHSGTIGETRSTS